MCLTGIWKGKKLLLKFNINLARLWAKLEEQSAVQWKAGDGSHVISTPKAEIMKKRMATNSSVAGLHIFNSKGLFSPNFVTIQWLFLLKCLIKDLISIRRVDKEPVSKLVLKFWAVLMAQWYAQWPRLSAFHKETHPGQPQSFCSASTLLVQRPWSWSQHFRGYGICNNFQVFFIFLYMFQALRLTPCLYILREFPAQCLG